MKIYMKYADIWYSMPSFALRLVTLAMIFIVAVSAFIGPVTPVGGNTYSATIKVLGGIIAILGSLYLTKSISLTLLRSGGTRAFQAAYIAAAALFGLGVAEALSAFWPANMGHALATYCLVSVGSGVLWVRFYGRAA
jgi:energy-converting hydrogenase Eha subunit C